MMRRAGFAGVRNFPAVAHQEATIEGDRILLARADANLAWMQRMPGVCNCGRNGLRQLIGVGRVFVAAEATRDRPGS